MTPIDTCVARIATLRRQRADVRRSITVHESLLLHADTKTCGQALGDVLRVTERKLTELINESRVRLSTAQLLARVVANGSDPHAAVGGAS